MRTQVTVSPTFWTRGSGKKLRGKPLAQVLAVYFIFSPNSTMVGLYYEPLISILHNTGLTEDQFRETMPLISEIALYDEAEGLAFLPSGAEWQVGKTLSLGDRKRKSILNQLSAYGNHPYARLWIERYYEPYNLSHDGIAYPGTENIEAPSKPHRSPIEAPSKGHSTMQNAPDPRSDPIPRSDPRSQRPDAGPGAPIVASLQVRAQVWVRDPFRASNVYPHPEAWTEMLELRDLVASVFGIEPDELRTSSDGRVKAVLERWAEGIDQARMRAAVRGAKHNDLVSRTPELQSLQTIFKDANAVDKYARLAKSKDPAPRDKSNKRRLTTEAADAERRFRNGEF